MKKFVALQLICYVAFEGNARGHFLQIDECGVYFEEAGTREAVLLIHDGLMSSACQTSRQRRIISTG